jgi:hypothetical protein
MILTYVAGPYTGASAWEVHRNVCQAEMLAHEVTRLTWLGYDVAPYCPHTEYRNMAGEYTPDFWEEITKRVLLKKCDAIIFTADWMRSKGSVGEKKAADEHRIPCFYSIESLRHWLDAEGHRVIPYTVSDVTRSAAHG